MTGVVNGSGGTVTNLSGGTVYGGRDGIKESLGTVINSGAVVGGSYAGIYARNAGTIVNMSGGLILGGKEGVLISLGGTDVDNAGVIYGITLYGIKSLVDGAVTNEASGKIVGHYDGINMGEEPGAIPGAVVNYGTIVGTRRDGIFLNVGGTVVNALGGTITGNYYGILVNATATVINAGTVFSAHGQGIQLSGGSTLTNAASGYIGSGTRNGVVFAGGATFTDAGTIVGGTGFDAVAFANGFTNRLILDPGAVLVGTVGGGNTIGATAVSTLELASTATAGTLAGLGSHYVDFASVAIDAGASWTLTGSNTLQAGTTLTNAGTLSLIGATLADAGVLINNGKVIVDPSSLTLGSLAGTGTTTIDPGSTLNVTGSVASGATIGFTGTGGVLGINPGQFAGRIVDFSAGDTLLLNGVTAATSATIVNGNTLEILQTGGPAIDLTLDNGRSFAGGTFTISPSGVITTNEAPCFLRDTRIRTDREEVAVQRLAVGDMVETLSGALRPIVWIGTGRVLVSPGRRSAATPVIVRKGALADNVPHRDLRITKGHSLYVDGVLIPAEFLINHRTILWDDRRRTVEFYHIELDAHDVLLAEGAPSESYRDDGNRWLFENANSGWDLPPKPAFAPVLTGGPFVDAAWRRIVDRAGPRAEGPVAADPDLHLCVDGQRIDALSRNGRAWHFRVPPNSVEVRIVSRSGIPSEMGTLRDSRRLGVAIERIGLWQGTRVKRIDSADGALEAGFHAHEPDNGYRWTDGDALLPLAWFVNFESSSELLLDVRTMPQYPGDTAPEVRAA